MSKLSDIQNEIAQLQKRVAELRSKEFKVTVEDIKMKMSLYGISIKDLKT